MAVYNFRKMKVELPVFHWTVEVVVTDHVVKYATHIGWQPTRDEDTTDGLNLFFDRDLKTVIILHPNASAGTVAHECWHSVYRMLTHMGASLDNETVAYHLGYLVQTTTDFLKKPRKKAVDKRSKS